MTLLPVPAARGVLPRLCGNCSRAAPTQLAWPTSFARNAVRSRASSSRALQCGASNATRRQQLRPIDSSLGNRSLSSAASPEASVAQSGATPATSNVSSNPILASNDLFHPLTKSPIPEMRRRAEYIKHHAYCPHPAHKPAHVSAHGSRPSEEGTGFMPAAHVNFECPDCGTPVYCSRQHWMDDYDAHLEICDTLRQVNEDDHDLRSGREFSEFIYAGPQVEEALINLTNWDTLLYTRDFAAINDDRGMRQATRLLTYPTTIASVLHELSPYNVRAGGRLTPEGLKSMSALQYTMHPPRDGGDESVKGLRPSAPPVRIFVLGARAESSLPRDVWVQLAHLFPRVNLHVILIGPESMANRDDEFPLPPRTASNPYGAIVEDRVWPTMKISTIVDYYHTIHKTGYFAPHDPYFDCFVLFHPGLGHPGVSQDWAETVPLLLETKAPIIVTGYTQYDMERDIEWVNKTAKGEFDMLLEPGENIFRSLRWDLNELDPQDLSAGNWGVWAFRGKRYEATRHDVSE